MCGLIFAQRRDNHPVGKAVLKRYYKQRERGKEGFGFLTIDKGKISGIHRFEKEADATEALGASQSSNILFHHRIPTSTPNYKDMTHPIVVKNKMLDKDYYVIHNGVLQNEDELKAKHEAMGFVYTTAMREISIVETISGRTEHIKEMYNDSEAMAIELALYLDGKQTTIDCRGTVAFICVEADKKDNVLNIHYGNNGMNPLVIEDNRDLLFIKSTGDGIKVDSNELLTINYITGEKTFKVVDIGLKYLPVSTTVYEDDAPVGTRVIGFGARDKDVPSPREYLPDDWSTKSRQQQLALSEDWGDDYDDPYNDNTDWEDEHNKYKLTEEYLLELWAEIEALQHDMKECKDKLSSGIAGNPLDEEDIIYNKEYYDECLGVLMQKSEESDALERYLNIKSGNGKLIK